jgi:DNA polymerase-1
VRTLLIDADVLAYGCSAAKETAYEWEPGYWTWHCDEHEVRAAIDEELDRLMGELEGTDFKLCLTDSEENFRKSILPTYKGNRAKVKKPLVLKAIREWMISEKGAYLRPHLEGDDCMGILATWSKLKGEKVIVSIDKDMKTIPGLYCRSPEEGIVEITEAEADFHHLYQTLIGDQTDGYTGLPGCGPKKALAILHDDPSWPAVVAAYEKSGLTEADALVQARVARILRASDYDFKTKEPILWRPS